MIYIIYIRNTFSRGDSMVDVDGKIPGSSVTVEEAGRAMLEHLQLYLEDGAAAQMWDSTANGGPGLVPTLLLKTVGARSGAERLSPLIYGEVGGAWILIGGVVVTESLYTIPGLGFATVDAVLNKDFPTIQGVILLFSIFYVVINLLIDISYTLLDPRIRY